MILKQQRREDDDDRRELLRHWVNANDLSDSTTSRKYRVALYWAFTTMTTVGYGDLSVVNNTEKLAAMFAMIVGGACFGYIIGGVTSILENLNLTSTLHSEKMDAIKEYLYDRQYPPVLATQIKKHFKHIYVTGGVFDMTAILETLPASTAVDLVTACYGDLVNKTAFLRRADRNFVLAVAPCLFPCAGDDGEFLFFEGSIGTHLFLIDSGMISIIANADNNAYSGKVKEHVQDNPNVLLPGNHHSKEAMVSSPAGIACGVCGAGEIVGVVATMLTFTNTFSAYVSHKAQLYALTKEALIDALHEHRALRSTLVQAAIEMQRHVSDCLSSETKENASIVGAPSTPAEETNSGLVSSTSPHNSGLLSSTLPLVRTIIEPIDDGEFDEPQEKLSQGRESDESKRIASVECKDDVLKHVEIAAVDPSALNKMARLIRSNISAMSSVSTERDHTKLGVLDQFRAPNNAQIHPGFDQGDEIERKLAPQINARDLWLEYWIIHPELPGKIVWDIVVCFLIIYSIVSVTYTIAFGIEESAGCLSWPRNGWAGKLAVSKASGVLTLLCAGIDMCIDLCFTLDMILSFQTAYVNESDQGIVYSKQQIAKKYASGWLIIDLASTAPIDKLVSRQCRDDVVKIDHQSTVGQLSF